MSNTVLIADDDPDIVELLAFHCEGAGLVVDTANNAMTALGKIEENPPDLAILDVDMPSGSGLGVCEMMSQHEELREIPVIVLTGNPSHEVVRRCHQSCSYYVPKCPDVWNRIEPLLQELMPETPVTKMPPTDLQLNRSVSETEAGDNDLIDAVFAALGGGSNETNQGAQESDSIDATESRPWVLSVEDDDDVALALRMRMREIGVDLVRATEGREGYRRAFLDAPHAVLLDYELPQGNGGYVLRRLKESPATRDIPVIVLTGRRDVAVEREMRGLGASEFFNKPLDWSELRGALIAHLGLTGLATRHLPLVEA